MSFASLHLLLNRSTSSRTLPSPTIHFRTASCNNDYLKLSAPVRKLMKQVAERKETLGKFLLAPVSLLASKLVSLLIVISTWEIFFPHLFLRRFPNSTDCIRLPWKLKKTTSTFLKTNKQINFQLIFTERTTIISIIQCLMVEL